MQNPSSRVSSFPEDYPAPPEKPNRVYQIWHDPRSPEGWLFELKHGVPLPFPGGYVHVADVRASTLREAVEKATHGYDPDAPGGLIPWPDKRGVRALPHPGLESPRDTQPGDVIVSPSGQPYRYELQTFEAIPGRDHAAPGGGPSYKRQLDAAATAVRGRPKDRSRGPDR